MRKENTTIRTRFISEAGSYLKNADYFAFVELEDCACYCIADGIDTDKEKESARLAVTAAIAAFQVKPKCTKACLKACITAAHKELLRESSGLRLEASMLILITDYQNYRTVHAGNAREYLFRNGKQSEQSKDMSVSQTMAEKGQIPKDKAEEHEERHNLYCYLGQPEAFHPEYSRKKKLKDGDIFLLCTRGIWQHTGTAEFMDAIEEAKEPDEVCTAIEEVILSRRLEKLDNYTIACIFIDKIYRDNGRRKKRIKRALMIAIPLILAAVIAGVTWYLLYQSNQKKISQMAEQMQKGIVFFQEESYSRAAKEFTEALDTKEKISYSVLLNKNRKGVREMAEELELYDRLLQLLLDGDEKMEKQDYSGAAAKYEKAKKLAREIPEIEEERNQIQSLMEQAAVYMDILELLQTGEKAVLVENFTEAMEAYQEAYQLASEHYAAEYKKEASEKLKEVKADISSQNQQKWKEEAETYEILAGEKEKNGDTEGAAAAYQKAAELYKQAEDTQKADAMTAKVQEIEEGEAEKQKENLLTEAERQMNQGDAAYEEGEYGKAMEAYQKAAEYYIQAAAADKLPVVESRMILAENKNTALAKQRTQAEEYTSKAEEKQKLGDNQAAYILYGLALEIYQEYGLNSEAEYMKQRMQETGERSREEKASEAEADNSLEEAQKAEAESSTEDASEPDKE